MSPPLDTSPPPRSYWTDCGPRNGPLLAEDAPAQIDVFIFVASSRVDVGTACHEGQISHGRKPAATWRLTVHGEELPGLYVCVAWLFIEEQVWRERIAAQREASRLDPRQRPRR